MYVQKVYDLLTKLGKSGEDKDLFPLLAQMAHEMEMQQREIKKLAKRGYVLVRTEDEKNI